MTVRYLVGDSLAVARTLPDASVDLVATSPPFLALRNYNDLDGQIGSEANPAAFLDVLLDLAVEWRRLLAPHGSIAVELGDSYSGAQPMYDARPERVGTLFSGTERRSAMKRSGDGWPLAKSLCGIPTLFAWSLAYGRNLLNPEHTIEPWLVRNVIVWARNNPPVGALGDKVRPATSYITVATPSPRRWFDLDAVRTFNPSLKVVDGGSLHDHQHDAVKGRGQGMKPHGGGVQNPAGAPPTDHWTDEYDGDLTWLVNTAGSKLSHYAMWPAKLAERLVLSMCPAQVCTTCGRPRERITGPVEWPDRVRHAIINDGGSGTHGNRTRSAPTLGWSDCGHGTWRNGHVLDPFMGTGTTGAVADLHGRDATGIDLDPGNELLYQRRYDEVKRALFDVAPEIPGQADLFGGAA